MGKADSSWLEGAEAQGAAEAAHPPTPPFPGHCDTSGCSGALPTHSWGNTTASHQPPRTFPSWSIANPLLQPGWGLQRPDLEHHHAPQQQSWGNGSFGGTHNTLPHTCASIALAGARDLRGFLRMETAQPRDISSPGAPLVWKAGELSTDLSLPVEMLKNLSSNLPK